MPSPPTGFSDQDQLSHDLLVRVLQQRITDYDLKEYEMPINQQGGVHTSLADLPLSVPLDSVKHYEDYIARLQSDPARPQPGHRSPPRRHEKQTHARPFSSRKTSRTMPGHHRRRPFPSAHKKYPAGISAEDQQRLTQQITDAINSDVIPAYKTFAAFLRTVYAPEGRTTLSITSLPDGPAPLRKRHLRPYHHPHDSG